MITVEDIINIANAISPKQNYLAQNDPALALVQALCQRLNEGGIGGTPVSYSTTITVTGNGTQAPFEIGPLPAIGPYDLVIYVYVTATTASAGTISVTQTANAGATVHNAAAVNLNGLNTTVSQGPFAATVLPVQLGWTVAGFGTGSATVLIIASAIKMF